MMRAPRAFIVSILLLASTTLGLRVTTHGSLRASPAKACPSVYVYDLPKHMMDHNDTNKEPWGEKVQDGFYDTSQYALGDVMLHRVAHSQRCKQVTDPKEADVFIVPMLAGDKNGRKFIDVCTNASLGHFVSHDELMAALPHLTPENAHKHALFVGKGHPKANGTGCASWWSKPEGLSRMMWRLSYSDLWDGPGEYGQQTMNLLRSEVTSSETSSMQYPNLRSVPYVSNVHWSNQYTVTPPWKEERERPLLMAFFGTQKNKTEYSKEIRPWLYKACDSFGSTSCQIFKGEKETVWTKFLDLIGNHHHQHLDMFEQKKNTKFCLEPAGDSPYRKSIAESLLAGCIPVIFSKQTDASCPWHWDDWKENSRVFIPEADLYSGKVNLKQHLESIPEDRIKEMQKTIAENAHKMQYALDDVPDDAVETILKHIAGWEKDAHGGDSRA